MSARRILVTGDRGFVGQVLTAEMRSGRYPDIEPVFLTDPSTNEGADVRDSDAVHRAIAHAQPTAVIHLAAISAPRQAQEEPELAWAVNFMGSFHVARALKRFAPKARLVWVGSSEAYGLAFNRVSGPIEEEAPLDPATVYGATKAAAEVMLGQMGQEGLLLTCLRPFNHSGPGQSADFVVPAFAKQIAEIEAGLAEPVVKVGNLTARRDFLDVRDVVQAYIAAATLPPQVGAGTYNLATGRPSSIASLLEILVGMCRVPVQIEEDKRRWFPTSIPVASGNPGKARNDLQWAHSTPLEKTLADVLAAWRTRVGVPT